jgi:Cysteine rich repeat
MNNNGHLFLRDAAPPKCVPENLTAGLVSMKTLAGLILYCAAVATPNARADDSAAMAVLRAGCADDAKKLCASVQPGGGRILACLRDHKDSLSDQCKQAAQQAAGMSGSPPAPPNPPSPPATGLNGPAPGSGSDSPTGSIGSAANGVAPAPQSSSLVSQVATPVSAQSPSKKAAGHTPVASNAASSSFLTLKKAQITVTIDQDPTKKPAIEMLIPVAWDLKGKILPFGFKGGCYSDTYTSAWQAAGPDQGAVFAGAPNYSWQYTDDPQEMRVLTDPNRREHDGENKVCPVSKPLTAEQYFRQNLIAILPTGTTILSVEPFPALTEVARQQAGLTPNDTNDKGTRVDAIRARVEFQDNGKPFEAWVVTAVIMRTYPVGRGSLYDMRAIDSMSFRAPKGQLDANDKLFQVMMASVHLTPEWSAFVNRTIAGYYQIQAKKEAAIDQNRANLQNEITQTYMQMSANAARASDQGFRAADQGIRGVQTFRDPSTGNTMELSSQYGHAWLNGNNEYVMSDDPNFNPNSQLSGNWNQLQAVSP